MRRSLGTKGVTLGCALVLFTGSAAAQDTDADAERLFREGQKLMEERRYGEACPKFADAYAKDRALGTLINLAFCHKEQGATWYAWLEFREAEVKAVELNRADRRDFAKQRLAELEKTLPKVVIDNPKKVALTDVLVDDRRVWEAERGAVFAAESGQRKLTFRAKGKKPATVLFTVPPKSDRLAHVAVPSLEDGPDETAATAALPVATADQAADQTAPPAGGDAAPARDGASVQRTLGWVALGVGGAGVVVGSIAGIITLNSPCRGGRACAQDEEDAGYTSGAIATASWVIGGLGILGGAALLLVAPPSSAARAGARAGAGAAERAAPTRSAGVSVTPQIGAGWAGLSGTF